MEKQQKRVDVRYLTELALLIALQFVMRMVGLGRVPVGPLYMSFLTVPIAVGAILLGPLAGGVLGAVFGGLSFYDAITGVSVMTGAFFAVDPLNTFVLCVGTRVLVGVCAGWIFRLLHLVDRKGRFCHWVGALATPVLNTVFSTGVARAPTQWQNLPFRSTRCSRRKIQPAHTPTSTRVPTQSTKVFKGSTAKNAPVITDTPVMAS
jgi:uncharacterized membrane protein